MGQPSLRARYQHRQTALELEQSARLDECLACRLRSDQRIRQNFCRRAGPRNDSARCLHRQTRLAHRRLSSARNRRHFAGQIAFLRPHDGNARRQSRQFSLAFSTSADKPRNSGQTDPHYGYDINSAQIVEKDGVVFYGTKNGLVLALNSKTGDILWEHKIGNTIIHTLAPLSAHRVVATDFDGKTTLLEN